MQRFQPLPLCRAETLGSTAGTSAGTTATSSGSTNTKGTAVLLGTSTFDWHWAIAHLTNTTTANYCVDILLDDGSNNRSVLIPDLRVWGRTASLAAISYPMPLHVPGGSKLYASSASSTASATVSVAITGFASGFMGAAGYPRCVSLYTPATSAGVSIDPGTSTNTKGSWTQMTASTADRVTAIVGFVSGAATTTRAVANWLLDIGVGAGGAEFALVPNIQVGTEATNDIVTPYLLGPYPCDIPAAMRIAARSQCSISTATSRLFDLSLWGLVP